MADVATARVGRPRSFEPEDLITTALELGPEQLTLRDVADALGVPKTTIYNHVHSRDELGRMVLGSLIAGHQTESWAALDGASWRVWLETFALRTRTMLLSAGPWLRYWTPEQSGPALRSAELVAGRMVGAGFDIDAATRALALVNAVVQASVSWYVQHVWAKPEPTPGPALSAEEFPWIATATGVHTREQEDEQFRDHLSCALDGIQSALERTQTKKA